MRIPEIFVPEKSLEKKVGELAKKKRNSKGRGSYDPTFEEINDRVTPIFEIWSKTIYGKHSQYNTINLKRLPEPYNGWIDFGSKNYDSEGFYCTMFDMNSGQGVDLRKKFLSGRKKDGTYHFKPYRFSIEGKLIMQGLDNHFWWYILKTTERGVVV